MNVVVIGGGVAGLASAVRLGRAGHDVTVIERDDTPMPETADQAFDWNRRGAPQVRHSHAFLARLRNLLRDHQPDILDALLAEGATEMRFGDSVPPDMDFTPEVAHGATVGGHRRAQVGAIPTVTGVQLDDRGEVTSDLVVAANGRRSAVAEWLADIGARAVTETVDDTGIVYASRFYRLLPDADLHRVPA